jgi:hypothetical protein
VAELSEAYRLSFKDFIQKLRRLHSLETNLNKNGAEVATASLELERARTAYYVKRDAVVQELLPSGRLGHVQEGTQLGWRRAH